MKNNLVIIATIGIVIAHVGYQKAMMSNVVNLLIQKGAEASSEMQFIKYIQEQKYAQALEVLKINNLDVSKKHKIINYENKEKEFSLLDIVINTCFKRNMLYKFFDISSIEIEIIKLLVDRGISLHLTPDGCQQRNSHLLHWACYHDQFDIVQFLITKKKVDINIVDDDGNNALNKALNHQIFNAIETAKIIEYLINQGITIGENATELMRYCVMHDNPELFKFLIKNNKIDIAKDYKLFYFADSTTLSFVVKYYCDSCAKIKSDPVWFDIINTLVQLGCQLPQNDNESLHKAAYAGDEKLVALLLEKTSPNRNAMGTDTNNRPIVAAAQKNHEHIIRLLINHKAYVHLPGEKENEYIKALLDKDPELNRKRLENNRQYVLELIALNAR